MPFEIVRNDITNMQVDAIVNTANPRPVIGLGTDSMIHEAAGPELLIAQQTIGYIDMGQATITPAFNLQAKYVIHTVGPVWDGGGYGEEESLRSCYDNSLKLAVENKCNSIAFPLISTGNYGFPKDRALQIAISAFSTFLLEHEMQIYLVVFDRTSIKLSEKLFQSVASYIDENYVADYEQEVYGGIAENRRADRYRMHRAMAMPSDCIKAPCAAEPCEKASVGMSIDQFIRQKDAGFMETLLDLIKKSGKKNATIYKKANISKQHFSKLVNNPKAAITKPVAVAFALALELDLEQTKELIGKAGYTLTNSSIFDLIIQFHIEQKMYNVIAINVVLYEYDQAILGSTSE